MAKYGEMLLFVTSYIFNPSKRIDCIKPVYKIGNAQAKKYCDNMITIDEGELTKQ